MKKIYNLLILFTLALCGSCGYSLRVPIDKNKLVTNAVIEFKKPAFTVKGDDTFLLSEKGLESNKIPLNKDLARVTEIKYALKAFKKQKYINYDITITSPKYGKPYYGKIAFFNTNKNNEMEAVSRYREISIDDSYFSSATRGRVAIMYEYATINAGLVKMTSGIKVPTWIILMSDEPF